MKIWRTGKPAIIPTFRTTVQVMPVEGMRDSLPNPDGVWGSAPCRIFTGMHIEPHVALPEAAPPRLWAQLILSKLYAGRFGSSTG